jgi:hypothetical protein
VKKQNPTITTQLAICQDIVQLSPGQQFTWKDEDRMTVVDDLFSAWSTNRDTSAIYSQASIERYNGQPLPRGVMARCCSLALAETLTVP